MLGVTEGAEELSSVFSGVAREGARSELLYGAHGLRAIGGCQLEDEDSACRGPAREIEIVFAEGGFDLEEWRVGDLDFFIRGCGSFADGGV